MKSFSFNRFGKTLRWLTRVNLRTLLMWTLGSVVGVFMGEMMLLKMLDYNDPCSMIYQYAQWGIILLSLVMLILISSVTSGINDKRKREAFLMLPSTNLEKFLSLVVYTTLICGGCVILALVVGDSLRMGWLAISRSVQVFSYSMNGGPWHTWYWWSSTVPRIIEQLAPEALNIDSGIFLMHLSYRVVNLTVCLGFFIWIHSLYTLGGTLLRKYSFVISSLVFGLCMLFFVQFMMRFDLPMFISDWDGEKYISQEVGVMGYVLAVALPLLSYFNYRASYRVFKGFQLISNKWTNYDILKR